MHTEDTAEKRLSNGDVPSEQDNALEIIDNAWSFSSGLNFGCFELAGFKIGQNESLRGSKSERLVPVKADCFMENVNVSSSGFYQFFIVFD